MQQHLGLKSDRAAPAGDPVDAAAPLRRRLPRRLLDWFARNRREFPWRRDRDAYRIWVSEVMLQQTQAAAVIPYFERFLRTFPTLADLAAADEQDVLRLWEGLGYYRRARDLLRTARLLAATNGGRFPDQLAALHGLPGLGRYTRNAVLSQAFDRRLPILEANSVRVLTRLFGRTGDPRRGPEQRWLWAAAEALLPSRRAGDFNQALMELGALVCSASRAALRGVSAGGGLRCPAARPANGHPRAQAEAGADVGSRGRRGHPSRRAGAVAATPAGRTLGVAMGISAWVAR